jgi:hypothetical protein
MSQVATLHSHLLLADTPNAVGWARQHTRDVLILVRKTGIRPLGQVGHPDVLTGPGVRLVVHGLVTEIVTQRSSHGEFTQRSGHAAEASTAYLEHGEKPLLSPISSKS